jgi:hypothetical protein
VRLLNINQLYSFPERRPRQCNRRDTERLCDIAPAITTERNLPTEPLELPVPVPLHALNATNVAFAELLNEITTSKAELAVLRAASPSLPTVATLQTRVHLYITPSRRTFKKSVQRSLQLITVSTLELEYSESFPNL